MIKPLVIDLDPWETLRQEASDQFPEEACGLLAGIGNRVIKTIPVSNILHSDTRYRMDPVEQLRAFQYIDDMAWELVGIYHSHPAGPEHPSETDLAEAYYPDAIYVILYPSSQGWGLSAYKISGNRYRQLPVSLRSESNERS